MESLTSYLVRLADAHGLSTASLVVAEYAPLFRCKVMDDQGHCDVLGKFSSALNGLGDFASEGARVLENMTTCDNLDRLTLLPLRDLVSPRSSVRPYAAWCPRCLADWMDAKTTIYSPLLWHLSPVLACPIHHGRLIDTCPQCRKRHFPLSRWSVPGHCPRCRSWLGDADATEDATESEIAVSAEANALVEAVRNRKCQPNPAIFSNNVRFLQDHLYAGSLSRFSRSVGLNDSSIRNFVTGRALPGLETLLRISVTTQVPSPKLAGTLLEQSDLTVGSARRLITFSRRNCRPYQWERIRELIVQATKAENPSSLHSFCDAMGLDPGRVSHALPKESRALIERTAAERSALKERRLQQAKLDIHRAVFRCFEEKKRLCHTLMERLMKRPGSLRAPELRAYRDRLARLAQRGELPEVGAVPLK